MSEDKIVIHVPEGMLTEEQEIKRALVCFIPCNACEKIGWKCECQGKAKCGDFLYGKFKLHFYEKLRENK